MQQRTSRAGGIFLVIAILGGTAGGIAAGNPMAGVLIGTGIGIVAAVGLWALDRRG